MLFNRKNINNSKFAINTFKDKKKKKLLKVSFYKSKTIQICKSQINLPKSNKI